MMNQGYDSLPILMGTVEKEYRGVHSLHLSLILPCIYHGSARLVIQDNFNLLQACIISHDESTLKTK